MIVARGSYKSSLQFPPSRGKMFDDEQIGNQRWLCPNECKICDKGKKLNMKIVRSKAKAYTNFANGIVGSLTLLLSLLL